VLKVDAGATLQLDGADAVNVAFAGSTGELILKDPAHFTGTIASATGSLTSADKIDLTNIGYSNNDAYTLSYDKGANVTTLSVTDGSTADTIKLAGNQTAATWTFSSDGHAGTIAVDPPASTIAVNHGDADHFNFSALPTAADHSAGHESLAPLSSMGSKSFAADHAALGGHGDDQFVFKANFGHDSNRDFHTGIDGDFHAGIDTTHPAQPTFQAVAEILTHATEAHLGAVGAHDQGHAVGWSHGQKDKPPSDFIVHA
jgi:hypothetical protein